ncbi:hypothetical protein RI054_44g152500 [Pseudoscourfieldia marina]
MMRNETSAALSRRDLIGTQRLVGEHVKISKLKDERFNGRCGLWDRRIYQSCEGQVRKYREEEVVCEDFLEESGSFRIKLANGDNNNTVRAEKLQTIQKHGGVVKVAQCEHCGATENVKTCQGCFTAHLCSRECIQAGWQAHKQACKTRQRCFAKVDMEDIGSINIDGVEIPQLPQASSSLHYSTMSFGSGIVRGVDSTGTRSANRNKGRFVVKVQCAGTGRMPHMIYNKERDVNASVGSNQGCYVKLREAVMSKGLVVYGNKGKAYFMAWLSSKKSVWRRGAYCRRIRGARDARVVVSLVEQVASLNCLRRQPPPYTYIYLVVRICGWYHKALKYRTKDVWLYEVDSETHTLACYHAGCGDWTSPSGPDAPCLYCVKL